MTKILFFLYYLLIQFTIAQSNSKQNKIQQPRRSSECPKSIVDSAEIYISKLNCNSAIVNSTYFELLRLDSVGQRLVELKDESLNKKLLSHFDDTSRVLAIHIILTERLEFNKNGIRIHYIYDKDYKNILRVNYSCNNFHWFYLTIDNKPECYFLIDKSEINRAKSYWTEKLQNLQ